MTVWGQPTLTLLRNGQSVQVDGFLLKKVEGEISSGDFYVAERNTGPHLLIAAEVKDGIVYAEGPYYPYNVGECVRVAESK